MKNIFILTTVFLGLGAPVVHAQAIATGESHPELLASAEQPAPALHKPSPSTPADDSIVSDAHAPVLPANGTDMEPATAPIPAADPTAAVATTDDPDYGIVTRVPHRPGELAEGTILRTHLNQAISTSYTTKGTVFSARLVADVMQDGHVIVPIGSTVRGKVTMVEEKRRVQGRAKLRLRADEIVLPDGSKLLMHAQVIDTSDYSRTKTDHEGTIVSRDDPKKSWIIAGSTTGAGAISGAVIGGPVGAVVGTAIGAGVGAGHYMMAHPVAALPESSTLVFQLTEPMSITPANE
jgi:hypothetical protein